MVLGEGHGTVALPPPYASARIYGWEPLA